MAIDHAARGRTNGFKSGEVSRGNCTVRLRVHAVQRHYENTGFCLTFSPPLYYGKLLKTFIFTFLKHDAYARGSVQKSPCPPFFHSLQLCVVPFLWLLHGPPPGFVWPSTRLQRDLMTFIIRWGNLIWAAPLSEMSSSIRSHAGENKRVSNYSLGVWVGVGCSLRVTGAQRVGDTERKSGSRAKERRRAWFMKEINSGVAAVRLWDLSWDLFPHCDRRNGPRYYPRVHQTGEQTIGEAGWVRGAVCGEHESEARLVMCD